jgi:Uma2 family endonuclease
VKVPLTTPEVRKLTVEDYYALASLGHLSPNERSELADGKIVIMLPIGFRHSDVQARLLEQLHRQKTAQFRIWPGGLRISPTGERYPDVSLVRSDITDQPKPHELFLLVEIADASLTYDLTEKKAEYEAAGVCEYWVIDVQSKVIFPFRLENRAYTTAGAVTDGEISPSLLPHLRIKVAELFSSCAVE